ncbi:MAG: hypothetical protein JWO78_1064 [Micavibrio sp.]|nr:hypothetical protein [Micavibrio sp.]
MTTDFPPKPKKDNAILPAFRLEHALDLTGIGQTYVMPEGETMESLDRKFFDVFVAKGTAATKQKLSVANAYATDLARLNPGIAAIRPDPENYEHTLAYIRGMTAGYNKDDIEFFLHVPESIRKDIYDWQREFLEKAGIVRLNWAPCPKTFEAINAQLSARLGPDWHTGGKIRYDGTPKGDENSRLYVQVEFE